VHTQSVIADTATVNEVIRLHPATVGVFNDFGIDACCGGAATVRHAAARDGADAEQLLDALNRAASGAAR
jgi:iron-sulfur cluster repair protein YtfE (RIC family)